MIWKIATNYLTEDMYVYYNTNRGTFKRIFYAFATIFGRVMVIIIFNGVYLETAIELDLVDAFLRY